MASTGKDAERFTLLDISRRKPSARAVMSMAQGGLPHSSLPDLRPGDRLLVSGEIEVTADHEVKQSDSVGVPYAFEPNVEVSLLLTSKAGTATVRANSLLLGRQGRAVGHRRHHDVVVFDNIAFDVPAGGLPWKGPAFVVCGICAWHAGARGGERLIIGQNEPGGKTSGDMSSISVARLRPGSGQVPPVARVTQRRATTVPVVINQSPKKAIYSHRLDDLRKGEQLRIRAGLKTNCKRFGHPVRTTVEVFLAEGPNAVDSGKDARRVSPESPQFCRGNGKNTLPEDAAMDSAKVGVLRIDDDAGKPMFVNVAVTTGDPLQKATRGNHSLDILDGGFLAVSRYPAASAG